jgi:hypothetical protein
MFKNLSLLLLVPFMAHLSAVYPSKVTFLPTNASVDPSTLYTIEEVPGWVHLFEYDMNPLASNEDAKLGFQALLFDKQENLEDKIVFLRSAFKILKKESASHETMAYYSHFTSIEYTPSFQQAVLHSFRVFRDGVWLDLHHKSHLWVSWRGPLHKILRFESHDFQPGDVLEFQYSLKQ